MPLHLKLTHALGGKQARFDDRGVDRPLVVGRGAEADLQVPSVQVSLTHCVLFVHEGRWIVQDAGSRAGTFVNGQRIGVPTPVSEGDEITLGPSQSNPPALTFVEATVVDATALDVEPQSAPVATADFYASDPEPTFPSYATTLRRRRSKRSSNGPVIAIMVVLAVAFAVVATVVILEKRKKAFAPPTPMKPPIRVEVVDHRADESSGATGSVLFGDTPPAKPHPSPSPSTSQPAATVDDMAESRLPATLPSEENDPRRLDPDWVRVEEAHRMSRPGEALAIFIDYQQRFPESPFRAEVQRYIDESLDRLWFLRMKQLADQRAELEKRKAGVERHLREVQRSGAADRQRVAEITARIEEIETRIAEVDKELVGEMGYDGGPVDPYNDSLVSALRGNRDPEKYERWTKWVLGSVRRTRGALPW